MRKLITVLLTVAALAAMSGSALAANGTIWPYCVR